MKISNDTLTILKWLSTINSGIKIDVGNKLFSKFEANSMVAMVEVEEVFPQQFIMIRQIPATGMHALGRHCLGKNGIFHGLTSPTAYQIAVGYVNTLVAYCIVIPTGWLIMEAYFKQRSDSYDPSSRTSQASVPA